MLTVTTNTQIEERKNDIAGGDHVLRFLSHMVCFKGTLEQTAASDLEHRIQQCQSCG